MLVSDFDFALPEALIAQRPAERRDASRLLVVPHGEGAFEHRAFTELPSLLAPGDLLVVNDARVIPARLRGVKAGTGGKAELLLVEELSRAGDGSRWLALGQASKALRVGQRLVFGGGALEADVVAARGDGSYEVALPLAGDALLAALAQHGELPLPPYIGHAPTEADAERYQTVFARVPGAVAAPTAGLHFTQSVLDSLAVNGVERVSITLHVGPGTFLPVRAERVEDHRMHAERYDVPAETSAAVARARARGGRVVAVGTTALRTLEASADERGVPRPGPGETSLFAVPGFRFRAVDALLTNFHLPKSTLLMLVAAFAGKERILAAYAEAIARGYRFFSYGDATLLFGAAPRSASGGDS